jgi:hypothetical protein
VSEIAAIAIPLNVSETGPCEPLHALAWFGKMRLVALQTVQIGREHPPCRTLTGAVGFRLRTRRPVKPAAAVISNITIPGSGTLRITVVPILLSTALSAVNIKIAVQRPTCDVTTHAKHVRELRGEKPRSERHVQVAITRLLVYHESHIGGIQPEAYSVDIKFDLAAASGLYQVPEMHV